MIRSIHGLLIYVIQHTEKEGSRERKGFIGPVFCSSLAVSVGSFHWPLKVLDGTKRLQSPDQKKVINRLPLNSLIPLFDIDLWSHTETSTANWALPEGGLGEGVEVRVPGFPWSPHH